MKILVVEDDASSRIFLERALKSQGYTVESAVNGADALEKAGNEVPDLIISDIMMPEMDGFELCRRVKSDKKLRAVPFVFYTATYIEQSDEKLAMQLGASRFLIKPMELDEFFTVIKLVIEEHLECKLPVQELRLEDMKELDRMQLDAVVRKLDKKVRELAKERKAARESEKRYRTLFQEFKALLDTIPDTLMLLDKNLKIVWSNKSAAELMNKDATALPGKFCYAAWHFVDTPCTNCPAVKSFASGAIATDIVTRPDGTTLDLRAVPVKDESGAVINVIVMVRDISEHRRMEDQIRHLQKMNAIGNLASVVAHDFNNILNVIVGYAGMMQVKAQGSPDDPNKRSIDQILQASERAVILTRSLLSFSRKQVMDKHDIDINAVLNNMAKFLERLLSEEIRLEMKTSDQPMIVNADRGQIEQVLMNLVTNGRDAMEKGGTMTVATRGMNIDQSFVEAHGYGKPGRYVVMEVSDTGIGMGSDAVEKIFEPFYTTKEEGKGTGLGLAIVYGIVKQHDGFINVYSEPEHGTTFKIYLPVIESAVLKDVAIETAEPKRGTETILLAEDEAMVRQMTRTICEHYGYTVLEAENGEDAIGKFMANKDRVKLIILDVIMPKSSGRQVYEAIRQASPGVKCIFMSGYSHDVIFKSGGLEAGMEFITKPLSPNQLMTKIRQVLDS